LRKNLKKQIYTHVTYFIATILLVKKGRIHLSLNTGTRKKRSRDEINNTELFKNEEKENIQIINELKNSLSSKNYNIKDIPHVLQQAEDLVDYLKKKEIMNEKGEMKI